MHLTQLVGQSDLFTSGRIIKLSSLISIINKLCFGQQAVSFIFRQFDAQPGISHQAIPQPCLDNKLTCTWIADEFNIEHLLSYELHRLLIEDNGKLIIVEPKLNTFDRNNIKVSLPDKAVEIDHRNAKRYPCDAAFIRITHNGVATSGRLVDFHAGAFKVILTDNRIPEELSFAQNAVVKVTITSKEEQIYENNCTIIRYRLDQGNPVFILSPTIINAPIQKPKKFRCDRVKPSPSPHIEFQHGLICKRVILDISEISGSGFSVIEDAQDTVMLPGMYIPKLELKFSCLFTIKCKARVVHRTFYEGQHGKSGNYACGLAFVDMKMDDHTKLVSYLHQAKNQHLLICHPPDTDALWNFFFDTRFVYPKKYSHIYPLQNTIKKNLERVFTKPLPTSRHFIFQEKGLIKGLIALQRVHKRTWLMHHFAARKEAVIAGPKVLSLIGSYLNDSYHLSSNRMKYGIIYYRQENKFPNLVFGGVARKINNPQICSLDTFDYFYVDSAMDQLLDLCVPWKLRPTEPQDLQLLEDFYMKRSGGLMIRAFDLLPDSFNDNELEMVYKQANLKRERHLYTLKMADVPIAIIMVLVSDIGINLSDLTNCIHAFIIDLEAVKEAPIKSVLSHLVSKHFHGTAAVNIFPPLNAKKLQLNYEKQYTLWTYEMQYSDYYYEHLNKLSRFLSIRK